jgi:hypothetical protein
MGDMPISRMYYSTSNVNEIRKNLTVDENVVPEVEELVEELVEVLILVDARVEVSGLEAISVVISSSIAASLILTAADVESRATGKETNTVTFKMYSPHQK